ncbi:hypothetical protein ACFVGY_14880 [Streptomyces sp. NPDC127106]|uniref:hypothetical protein n=1 Tax=Streptomyces sp. NPDC127106 TaxID=3345360 RepID=UPI003636785E
MSGIEACGRKLRLDMLDSLGQAAGLVLALPSGLTGGWKDVERRHRHRCEGNGLRPLWTVPQIDPVESAYLDACASLERSRVRRAAVGSALLRRIALFPTVTAFYRVQCWYDGDTWKIDARTAHPRAVWHDQLMQRLDRSRPVPFGDQFLGLPDYASAGPCRQILLCGQGLQHRLDQAHVHPVGARAWA